MASMLAFAGLYCPLIEGDFAEVWFRAILAFSVRIEARKVCFFAFSTSVSDLAEVWYLFLATSLVSTDRRLELTRCSC